MKLSDNIFRTIVEISPFPVYVCTGEDLILTVANNATLKAWGKDKSVLGKPFKEALPEMENQPFENLIRRVYATGEDYITDNDPADFIIEGKMQRFYFKFTYQAMHDDQGNIDSVLCFATDVTELERARQAVEKSRESLYNMVRQAPVGICIINVEGLIVDVANDSYLELVGKKLSEVQNKPIWGSVPEAADLYAPILDQVIETGITFYAKEHEVMLVRKGVEEIVFLDFVYEPITDIDGKIYSIMVTAIEITEMVVARRRIEEAEERARLAVEAAEIGTFDLDLITNAVLTSERCNNIFGFDHSVSRDVLTSVVHPDDREIIKEAHQASIKTGTLFYEARVLWSDNSIHWVRVQGKVYYNANRIAERLLGTILDITEFKRLQQQKDDFISVASHELKTPMTNISASIQLLGRLIKTDPASDKVSLFINKANSSLMKMQQLVESLLNVSKITAGQLVLSKTRFKVSQLIDECCDHVRMEGKFQIRLTGDKDLEVYADKDKLDQVMVNLVNNAVKYADNSTEIIVDVFRLRDMVKVTVRDFGRGVPADKIEHLFKRYYRVDATGLQYSGLGLGLYISADIIERHGGEIGVESEEGKGSTFWFTVPCE